MKCVAIDDEPIALEIIKKFCNQMGGLEIETFSNPLTGLEAINRTLPDLVFLDIEMKGIHGLELARKMPAGVMLIFTTAYAQFALDGFELNAIDFLHKPYSFGRFETAVKKAIHLKSLQTRAQQSDEQSLVVKADYKNIKIICSEIIYLEAINNYVKIHLNGSHPVLTQCTLKSLIESLPEQQFLRVHKSFVVNRAFIVSFSRTEVVLPQGKILPVGRTYADALQQ